MILTTFEVHGDSRCVRFDFNHQGCGGNEWHHVGSEEAESAEEALERLSAGRDLESGWYRAKSSSGDTSEFFLDGLGITAVAVR